MWAATISIDPAFTHVCEDVVPIGSDLSAKRGNGIGDFGCDAVDYAGDIAAYTCDVVDDGADVVKDALSADQSGRWGKDEEFLVLHGCLGVCKCRKYLFSVCRKVDLLLCMNDGTQMARRFDLLIRGGDVR